MKMKITLIGIAAIIALYLYGNHLLKKKKQMIDSSSIKQTYEAVKTSKLTVEEMLCWYKSHNDVDDNDEYVLSRVTKDTMKQGGIDLVMPNLDIEHSLLLLITDISHKNIKHARIVTFEEVEQDILDMLGDKNMIVLE